MSKILKRLFAAVAIMAAGAYADGGCLFTGPGIPVETSAQLARDEMGSRARIVPITYDATFDRESPGAISAFVLERGRYVNAQIRRLPPLD